jgi:hypothetical protein
VTIKAKVAFMEEFAAVRLMGEVAGRTHTCLNRGVYRFSFELILIMTAETDFRSPADQEFFIVLGVRAMTGCTHAH